MANLIKMLCGSYVCLFLWPSIGFTNDLDRDEPDFKGSKDPWCFQPIPSMDELARANGGKIATQHVGEDSSATSQLLADASGYHEFTRPKNEQPQIDSFILHRLKEHGLSPNKRALPHRQLRRLSFMLTGLPPKPSIVERFVGNPSEEQYKQLVDHYLDSPQFGERWARHWMDVVRFAETWGYEWNHLVREAWRYRDYLIRAFNEDVPFDQLVREHIAGDLLKHPRINTELGINESLIGTAFYRFGETGHDDCVLYPDISLDVMDNQIDTLSKAFQAMTVSCSRCHDHKLDDIPQSDYYALLGVMASSRQVIRTLDLPHRQDELKKKLRNLKQAIRSELGEIWLGHAASLSADQLNSLLRSEVGDSTEPLNFDHPLFVWQEMSEPEQAKSWMAAWNDCRSELQVENNRRLAFNRENYETIGDFTDKYHNASGDVDANTCLVEADGWAFEGLSVEDGNCFTASADFSVLPDGPNVLSRVLPSGFFSHALSQRFNAVVRSPLLPECKKYVSYQAMGIRKSVCRTVIANCTLPYFHTKRFDSSKLEWSTVNLAHVRKSPLVPLRSYLEWATALDDQGFPVLNMPQAEYQKMLDNPQSCFGVTKVVVHDVDRPPYEPLKPQLELCSTNPTSSDALAKRFRALLQSSVEKWTTQRADATDVFWLNAFIDMEVLGCEQDSSTRLHMLVDEYRKHEHQVQTPRRIVGMSDQHGGGFDVPLLEGGDISVPQDLVRRGFLTAVEKKATLTNREGQTVPVETSGRRGIAEMIAHPENPLTARVMANRIWHYLLGRGIVRSVDNFGELGDKPSHPMLLDYLARRLIDSRWSVKTLVREIVLSDTFRQSSATSEAGRLNDPENRLFHRYISRRMEAESIRDAMLAASGRLDPRMYGPSVNPFRAEDVDRRKLYSGPLDGAGRRSLYLKVTRMGAPKLLELFNFPDPSTTRGRRDKTNVPTQALGLMNHPFVHQQAEVTAQWLMKESHAVDFDASLEKLFIRVFGRRPSSVEILEYREFFNELSAIRGVDSWDEAVTRVVVWKDLIHTLYNLKEFSYVL